MRIVDAESQLLDEFVDEIEISATRERSDVTVMVGRHPLLGKVVVIKGVDGGGLIVEADE